MGIIQSRILIKNLLSSWRKDVNIKNNEEVSEMFSHKIPFIEHLLCTEFFVRIIYLI